MKEHVGQFLLVPAAGREGGGVEEQQDSGLPPSTATSGSLVAPPSVAGRQGGKQHLQTTTGLESTPGVTAPRGRGKPELPSPDPTWLVVAFASEPFRLNNAPPDRAGEEQVVFADPNIHLPLLQRGKASTVNVSKSLPLPTHPLPPSCRHDKCQPL